jgi:hypothetical protein
MKEAHGSEHHLVEVGGRFLAYTIAIVVGFVLAIVGLGLGVTMVLLPIGLPVGLVGVVILGWGLFGHSRKPTRAMEPRGSPAVGHASSRSSNSQL